MNELLQEITSYIQARDMCAYTFGYKAARNGRLVERLQANRRVWPETEKRIRLFMQNNPPEADKQEKPKRGRKFKKQEK